MHTPPAVSYPVRRSRFALFAWLGLWLLAAVALVAWAWILPGMETAVAALVLISVHGTTVLLISKRQPTGTLVWDGASWYWHPQQDPEPGQQVTLAVVLDVQGVMCLRLQRQDTRQAWRWPGVGGQAALWVWLERQHAAERWAQMRHAVFARCASTPSTPHSGSL